MSNPCVWNGGMDKIYPTDLNDNEWNILRPLLPLRAKRGRPPTDRRRVINAIRYWLRAGCAWRLLPHEFVPLEHHLWHLPALGQKRPVEKDA